MWILLGHRTGDNHQLDALAQALGWPCERKQLRWRRPQRGWTLFYGRMKPSLAPLEAEARAEIAPPWPDLVLSVGWRSVPVARWIKRQSGARLVHLGRPRAPLGAFDLVLTTPQYRVPAAPNVLDLGAPLTRLSPERLAAAAETWRPRLAHLPRPWIGVLIGGDAPPLRLTPEAARSLGEQAEAMAANCGGSLLVATGPRTGKAAAEAFLSRLTVPSHIYLWGEPGENPYSGYLALADEFVVTADSISMAHEAAMTGRPVRIFPLPLHGGWRKRVLKRLDDWARKHPGIGSRMFLGLVRTGFVTPPRAPEEFHARLSGAGQAGRHGNAARQPAASPGSTALDRAVEAIRTLMAE